MCHIDWAINNCSFCALWMCCMVLFVWNCIIHRHIVLSIFPYIKESFNVTFKIAWNLGRLFNTPRDVHLRKKIMNFLYSRYYCWMHSSSYPYFSFLVWVGCAGCMQIFAVYWWIVTKQYRMFLCMFADDSCSFTLCSKAEAMFRLYVSPVGKHRACVCSAGVQLNTV